MSGETERNPSGLSSDNVLMIAQGLLNELDKRVTQRMDLSDKAITAALAAAEKAVGVAELTAQRWRESANEWRGTMDDRERNFASKDSTDVRIQGITDQISELRSRLDRGDGVGSGQQMATTTARFGRDEGRQSFQVWIAAAVLVVLTLAPLLSYLAAHAH